MDLGELAAAAGLLLVPVVRLGLAGDRLQVGDVRDVGVDVELVAVLEPVLDHVQVQLAHARDDQLVRLGVAAEGEGRVLVGDLGQADARSCGSSSRVFGSTARGTIGVGNLIGSSFTCGDRGRCRAVETVSETCRSSNLAIATMSPAIASLTSSCVLPWSR